MAFKTAMNVSKLIKICPQIDKHSVKCLQPGWLNVFGISIETRTVVSGWRGTPHANRQSKPISSFSAYSWFIMSERPQLFPVKFKTVILSYLFVCGEYVKAT